MYNIYYLIWCDAKTNIRLWIIYDAYRRIGVCVGACSYLIISTLCYFCGPAVTKGCWFPRNKTWHKEEEWVSTKYTLGLSSWLNPPPKKTLKISILIRKSTLPCLHLQVCMKMGASQFKHNLIQKIIYMIHSRFIYIFKNWMWIISLSLIHRFLFFLCV